METLPRKARIAEDGKFQTHWYQHAGALLRGMSILDAGAGIGYGLALLREAGAAVVVGFDVAPLLPNVAIASIEDYGDESFDAVVAMDVIEHVQDDRTFLTELLRVARTHVFFSTPNWNVSRAANVHHAREYTPVELQALLASFGFTKPLGAVWHDGVNDHRIYVSNHECVITTREAFDPDETWHNHGVLLEKARRTT